MIYNLK